MAAPTGIMLRNVCGTLSGWGILKPFIRPSLVGTQQCRFAARKGTREKARKKKVKVEEKKIGFIPHNQRENAKNKIVLKSRKLEDWWKNSATDNVWTSRYYRWRVYSFEEGVRCHRETHHPTIYNQPNAPVNITIELDMKAEKKNRFVDKFSGTVAIPHGFNHGLTRSILAFVKTSEEQKEAMQAGASMAGGADIIRDIQSGELALQDFEFVVSTVDMLPDLVPIRGLMKRRFPNPKSGTLGTDVGLMVKTFKDGIQFAVNVEDREKEYGWIDTCIGTLDMETSQLQENLSSVLRDVNRRSPLRKAEPFIWRVLLTSPPSVEKLKIDHVPLLGNSTGEATEASDAESDNEGEEEREAAKQ